MEQEGTTLLSGAAKPLSYDGPAEGTRTFTAPASDSTSPSFSLIKLISSMYSAHPVIHWLDYALSRTLFAVSRFAMTFLPVQLLLFWTFFWPTAIKLTLLHIPEVSTYRH